MRHFPVTFSHVLADTQNGMYKEMSFRFLTETVHSVHPTHTHTHTKWPVGSYHCPSTMHISFKRCNEGIFVESYTG